MDAIWIIIGLVGLYFFLKDVINTGNSKGKSNKHGNEISKSPSQNGSLKQSEHYKEALVSNVSSSTPATGLSISNNNNKHEKRTHIITKLPECSYISVFHLSKVKVNNPKELKRFQDYQHLIEKVKIYRDYFGKVREKGTDRDLIYTDRGLSDVEFEAKKYFINKQMVPMSCSVRHHNTMFNIFFLASCWVNNMEKEQLICDAVNKYLNEIKLIAQYVSKKDIRRFSKYLIGIPDLLVIDTGRNEYFFCEVKSRFDRLQDTQKLWFLKNFIDYKPKAKYQLLKIYPTEDYSYIESAVVGLRYRCSKEYLDRIELYDKMLLERDRLNPYDSHGVKVINASDRKHIGFIPKIFNKEKDIWKIVEENRVLNCFVTEIKALPTHCKNSHKMKIKIIIRR